MARNLARAVGKQQSFNRSLLVFDLLIVRTEALASDPFDQRVVSPLVPGLFQRPDFSNRLREDLFQQGFLGSMFDQRIAGGELQRTGNLANSQGHTRTQPDSTRGNRQSPGKRFDRGRWKNDVGPDMSSRCVVHHLERSLGLELS